MIESRQGAGIRFRIVEFGKQRAPRLLFRCVDVRITYTQVSASGKRTLDTDIQLLWARLRCQGHLLDLLGFVFVFVQTYS